MSDSLLHKQKRHSITLPHNNSKQKLRSIAQTPCLLSSKTTAAQDLSRSKMEVCTHVFRNEEHGSVFIDGMSAIKGGDEMTMAIWHVHLLTPRCFSPRHNLSQRRSKPGPTSGRFGCWPWPCKKSMAKMQSTSDSCSHYALRIALVHETHLRFLASSRPAILERHAKTSNRPTNFCNGLQRKMCQR